MAMSPALQLVLERNEHSISASQWLSWLQQLRQSWSQTAQALISETMLLQAANTSAIDTTRQTLFIKPAAGRDPFDDYAFGLGLSSDPDYRYYLDFSQGALAYRFRQSPSIKQDILRAVGIKPGYRPRILDCHAGLGRDSMLFASAECEVVCSERHPAIYLALADALRRACKASAALARICQRIDLRYCDAITLLEREHHMFDSVYLDPMFPERSKSAKVKRESQILQDYCGKDDTGEALLSVALNQRFRRICVKRPIQAAILGDRRPNYSYQGKTTRFDIYTTAANASP